MDICPCYQGTIHDSGQIRSHYTRHPRTRYTTKYPWTSTSIRPHRINPYCPLGSASSQRNIWMRSTLDTKLSILLHRRFLHDNHLHNSKQPFPQANLGTSRSRQKLEYTISTKTESLLFWYTTNLGKYAEYDISNVTTPTTSGRRLGRWPGRRTVYHEWRSNP